MTTRYIRARGEAVKNFTPSRILYFQHSLLRQNVMQEKKDALASSPARVTLSRRSKDRLSHQQPTFKEKFDPLPGRGVACCCRFWQPSTPAASRYVRNVRPGRHGSGPPRQDPGRSPNSQRVPVPVRCSTQDQIPIADERDTRTGPDPRQDNADHPSRGFRGSQVPPPPVRPETTLLVVS